MIFFITIFQMNSDDLTKNSMLANLSENWPGIKEQLLLLLFNSDRQFRPIAYSTNFPQYAMAHTKNAFKKMLKRSKNVLLGLSQDVICFDSALGDHLRKTCNLLTDAFSYASALHCRFTIHHQKSEYWCMCVTPQAEATALHRIVCIVRRN